MEKGIDAYIKEQFHLPPVDIRTYSPLTLAYIGDGFMIRSSVPLLLEKAIPKPPDCIRRPANWSAHRHSPR